ncbi:MAG TPA: hypothetical protein VJK03_01260 [Candidatus Nanoarchaeia archaeon]|nr:hypothetical protein [Candidatus Nanoarchaeia archaeon]
MLTEQQIAELREHLEKAQNPIFYYDNDADGLCSFLLFRRYIGRGKGVAVRSYPELNEGYVKKAEELKADYVFILDKPVLSEAFVAALTALGLPIVWIDHHSPVVPIISSSFFCYNSAAGLPDGAVGEPVTDIAQCVCGQKADLWIAMMGCIADHYLPNFVAEFERQWPEYWGKNIRKPFDAYYGTEIGRLARALNFGLKDSISHVVQLQSYLFSCRVPEDVLADNDGNAAFRTTYYDLSQRYEALLQQAEKHLQGSILFFSYGGATSMSADVANELSYKHPNCYIAVAYSNGGVSNISLRGNNVKAILASILPRLSHASGGGHKDAVGARIRNDELPLFHNLLIEEVAA